MEKINWKSAIWAGIIAGIIFMMLEMIMVPLFMGGSPWGPPRLIAAIIMGKGVLPPPANFDFGMFVVAMLFHLVMSVIYAIIIAFIVKNMTLGKAVLVGAVIGLVIYFINFYVMTGIFPWFSNAHNWVTAFTHVSFGIGAAWAYIGLQGHYVHTTDTTTTL